MLLEKQYVIVLLNNVNVIIITQDRRNEAASVGNSVVTQS